MDCLACNFANPSGMKFCGNCGSALSNPCPKCGADNPHGFKFCGQCATLLRSQTSKEILPSKEYGMPHMPVSERRHLTVVFCDLVGSTALSEILDPEDFLNVLQMYYTLCQECVSRYDGYIAKYLGDGLLIYFGYPQAQEDDAMQAIRASLDIIKGLERIDITLYSTKPISLNVRIGIHTGLAIISTMGVGTHTEKLDVVGETPNVAARLQSLAEPGSILISRATYLLVKGFFECESLGTIPLKGISAPMEVFRVTGATKHSRFEIAQSHGLTSFVGREAETRQLFESWKQVQTDNGQVLLLCGEAGVGKTRLLQMLKDNVPAWVESRCSSTHQSSALYPVIEMLERLFFLEQNDSTQRKINKIEKLLFNYGLNIEETLPYLLTVLSIPAIERYPSTAQTPEKVKHQILQVLQELFKAMAAYEPLVFVVEDLHWADPSTIELIGLFIQSPPKAPLLIVLTHRPEFTPLWSADPPVSSIAISRLSRQQVEEMILKVADGKQFPGEIIEQIVSKSDGVPLFVEELCKMVLESGLLTESQGKYSLTSPSSTIAIPSTLQGSLMARLDKLSTLKEVIQISSVIGREFTYELLLAVSSIEEKMLREDLERLVDAEMLNQSGLPPNSKYIFKHALIQDAAYNSILKSKRQHYHRQIATILEERFTEITESQPELLAYHCGEGDLINEAIHYWQKAGQRSKLRSAYPESITQFNNALDLLKKLPVSDERNKRELTLTVELIAPLSATKSFASAEVETVTNRAKELCEQTGETTLLFPVLFGLQGSYYMQGKIEAGAAAAQHLYSLATDIKDSSVQLISHFGMGMSYFYLGNPEAARFHFKTGIGLYDPEKHKGFASVYSFNPGVVFMRSLAIPLWLLGFQEQAMDSANKAIEHAREINNTYNLANALTFAAMLCYHRFDPQATRKYTEEAISICTEHGYVYWLMMSNIFHGWALMESEIKIAGLTEIQKGIAAWKDKEWELFLPCFFSILSKAYSMNEQYQEAEKALDEGIALMNKTHEFTLEPELLRLKGEMKLKNTSNNLQQNKAEAEALFKQSLEAATHQKAKSLELRTAISLSRLWHKQGKSAAAKKVAVTNL